MRVVSESNTIYQSIDAVDPLTTIGVSNSSVMVAVCRCVGLSQYSIILRRVVRYRLSVYDVLLNRFVRWCGMVPMGLGLSFACDIQFLCVRF